MLKRKLKAIYNWYLSRKWLKTALIKAKKNGFSDFNDYVEKCADNLAQKATEKLFRDYGLKLDSGIILDVGAGMGRFTREIKKYIPENVKILCLENAAPNANFLKKYKDRKGWTNVTVIKGDYFNYDFKNIFFDMVIIPWFIQLSLYQWAKVLEIGSKIVKPCGYIVFDFIDAQDSLIEAISNAANAPHYLINGKDVEIVANHFGFIKKSELKVKFNTQMTKFFVYQKENNKN